MTRHTTEPSSGNTPPLWLNAVCALPCEARGLIDAWSLKKDPDHAPFALYRNKKTKRQLIISGVGALHAAAATTYLACHTSDACSWMNVGIAGARGIKAGTLVHMHKVTRSITQSHHYPQSPVKHGLPNGILVSLENPGHDYQQGVCMDMEGAAFFSSAMRFHRLSHSGRIMILKCISDTRSEDQKKITPDYVKNLLAQHTPVLSALAEQLQNLPHVDADAPELGPWLETWHFSVYQQHQLKKILSQLKLIHHESCRPSHYTSCKNAQDVIKTMTERAKKHSPFTVESIA